jgi:hypothetical protein
MKHFNTKVANCVSKDTLDVKIESLLSDINEELNNRAHLTDIQRIKKEQD